MPTPAYVRFATHYGFRPDFCEGADPESKGIVENLVGYAKSDLMIPEELSVEDLATANGKGLAWCDEVNALVHSEICAVPLERLDQRARRCSGSASLRARIGKVVMRKVDRLACVRFGSARYSVPRPHRTPVEVVAHDGRVLVLDDWARSSPTTPWWHRVRASVVDEHYGGARPARPVPMRPETAAEKAFCALGPVAEAFIRGAAAAGMARSGRTRRAGRTGGRPRPPPSSPRWNGRSHSGGSGPHDVRSILAAGLGVPRPSGPARAASSPSPLSRPALSRTTPLARTREHRAAGPARRPEAGLRRLRLRHAHHSSPELLVTAKTQRWKPEEFLRTLVEAEIASRDASNARDRLKAAAFPVTKTLDEFDIAASSVPQATFDYLARTSSGSGPRRTSASSARPAPARATSWSPSGHAAVEAGYRVRYFSAAELVETLYRGLADNSVGRVIEGILRADLSSSTRSASPR